MLIYMRTFNACFPYSCFILIQAKCQGLSRIGASVICILHYCEACESIGNKPLQGMALTECTQSACLLACLPAYLLACLFACTLKCSLWALSLSSLCILSLYPLSVSSLCILSLYPLSWALSWSLSWSLSWACLLTCLPLNAQGLVRMLPTLFEECHGQTNKQTNKQTNERTTSWHLGLLLEPKTLWPGLDN